MGRYHVLINNLPLSIISDVYYSKGNRYSIGKYNFNSKDDRYLNFVVNRN